MHWDGVGIFRLDSVQQNGSMEWHGKKAGSIYAWTSGPKSEARFIILYLFWCPPSHMFALPQERQFLFLLPTIHKSLNLEPS